MTPETIPEAVVVASTDRRRRRISLIWIIPAVAVLIAAWLAWHTLSSRGPTITITFDSAEGLQAGQSTVKFKDVQMGLVETIRVASDLRNVIVTVRMNPEAVPLLNDQTVFWVVKPQLFAGNVQGLGTLLSGSFIGMLPTVGHPSGRHSFVGSEDPPVLQTEVPGRTFMLHASQIGSLNLGSPVFYRDLEVGVVLGWDLGKLAENVTIHAFVRAPFDQYVHDESRFWNASGVSVQLGAEGLKVQVESLKAVLLGGIAFETPPEAIDSAVSHEGQSFTLYASQDAASSAAYRWRVAFVSYFESSVAGLGVGAAVTFRGLRVGHVTDVRLEYDPTVGHVRVPVHFYLEPDRIAQANRAPWVDAQKVIRGLVAKGLRAQLQSASLLTGQLEVALELVPNAAPAEMSMEGDVIVLPSVAGGLGGMMQSVQQVLDQVSAMPLRQIGENLNRAIQGMSDVVNGAQVKDALTSLQASLADAEQLIQHADASGSPLLKRLPQMANELDQALARASKLVGSLDEGYGDNSKFKRDLDRLLDQTNDTVRSVRVLADILSRHPEALIRGRNDKGVEP
jgi:paraquat-inducible protein B